MPRSTSLTAGQAARSRPVPARVRRALRRGPRTPVVIRPARYRAGDGVGPGLDEGGPAGALREWHDMTPGQLIAQWAGLRAWVRWLAGRYELTVEDRLPTCDFVWFSRPRLFVTSTAPTISARSMFVSFDRTSL